MTGCDQVFICLTNNFSPWFLCHCLQASCSFLVSNKSRSYLPQWLCVPFSFAQTYPGWLISSLFRCTATEWFALFLLIALWSSFMSLWTSLHFAPSSYDASHPSSIPSIKHSMCRRARSTTQGLNNIQGTADDVTPTTPETSAVCVSLVVCVPLVVCGCVYH